VELISGLVIAVIAFAAGTFLGKYIAPNSNRIKELEEKIEANNQQHQTYKDTVAEHFSESASLFGDITEKYRSLYDHMSSGAYELCDRRSIPRELASSHVNILAVESPEVSPQLTDHGVPVLGPTNPADEFIVDVTRPGLSPLDSDSQQIVQNSKSAESNSAEIINLDSQRNEEDAPAEQAKDYAIKAKGVINHNSLEQEETKS